jgi:hypothetical protein
LAGILTRHFLKKYYLGSNKESDFKYKGERKSYQLSGEDTRQEEGQIDLKYKRTRLSFGTFCTFPEISTHQKFLRN